MTYTKWSLVRDVLRNKLQAFYSLTPALRISKKNTWNNPLLPFKNDTLNRQLTLDWTLTLSLASALIGHMANQYIMSEEGTDWSVQPNTSNWLVSLSLPISADSAVTTLTSVDSSSITSSSPNTTISSFPAVIWKQSDQCYGYGIVPNTIQVVVQTSVSRFHEVDIYIYI